MFLKSARTRKELSEVLLYPDSVGPDPVYLVFSGVNDGDWENTTVISNGTQNGEYPKTYGHYHPENSPTETYKVLSGDGAFLLQEKFIENGNWIKNKVKNVVIIKAEKGKSITIPDKWGHCSINVGQSPFVTIDNWKSGHTPADYEPIKQLRGMVYYLTEEKGTLKFVKNPNYVDHPAPLVMTTEEFARYQQTNI